MDETTQWKELPPRVRSVWMTVAGLESFALICVAVGCVVWSAMNGWGGLADRSRCRGGCSRWGRTHRRQVALPLCLRIHQIFHWSRRHMRAPWLTVEDDGDRAL